MFSIYILSKILQIPLFRSPSISFTFKRLKTWTSCAGAWRSFIFRWGSVILIAFVILEVWKCEFYIFKGQRYHKDWEPPPTEKPRVYQPCHERHRGEHFEINVEEKHRNSLHFGHNQTLLFSFSDCQLMIMIIYRFTTIRWWMVSQAVRVWRSWTSPSTLLARDSYIISLWWNHIAKWNTGKTPPQGI